jgi:hypothetical protein
MDESRERIEIYYDPDGPESILARKAVRRPLLVLARARDGGRLDEHTMEQFNGAINEVTQRAQDDPEFAVRALCELVFGLDRAVGHLARRAGTTNEAALRAVLRV